MTEFVRKEKMKAAMQKGPRLKVLMLSWEFPPNVVGGLSKHVYGLSKQLVQLGLEVHVLTANTGVEMEAYEKHDHVHVHRVKPLNESDDDFLSWVGGLNLAMIYKAADLARQINFTIIHAHDWLVGAAAITLKEWLKLPLLSTIHATEHGRNDGIHNEMQRFIHEKEAQLVDASDQVIVCSSSMKQELITIFGTSEEKMAVIPNGINLQEMNSTLPLWLKPEGKKLIFSVGRMVKEKGFETIIAAAQLAKEQEFNIFFVIAGKGPMLEKYRQFVFEKDLQEHLAFIGYISDEERNGLILQSDVTVFPSLYEPFGIVALESMILGRATIVSDVGGLKGIIKHKQTGMLMVPGSPESLLQQANFLLNHPDEAQRLALNGMLAVKRLYGWERVAVETKRIMEDLILDTLIMEMDQK